MPWFASTLKTLARDTRANIGMMTALLALPLIGVVGLSIDYGTTVTARSRLDVAADAAVLSALKTTKDAITGGTIDALAISQGQAQGLKMFTANAGAIPYTTIPTPTLVVTRSGQTLNATINYQTTIASNFGRLFGTTQFNQSGNAAASLTMPTYMNIYMVLDVSSSMGIGATDSDQQITYNATGGCAVACHFTNTTTQARNAGATLRIDVAKQAIVSALRQIDASSDYTQVALYTMSNKFTNVYALSSDFSGAITAVNGIDISASSNDGGTNTTYALKQLANALPTPGTGLTQATAQGVVMLITDGVQDSDMKYYSGGTWADKSDPNFTVFSPCSKSSCTYNSNFGLYFEAFDPAQCSPIKTKGYSMMTLNVKYLIPPTKWQSSNSTLNDVFTYIQQNLLQSIPTNMTSCASSSSMAFSASTPAEINTAVANMFATSISLAHLTQ